MKRPPLKHLIPQTVGDDMGGRYTWRHRLRNTPLSHLLRKLATNAAEAHRREPTLRTAAQLNFLTDLNGAWVGVRARFHKILGFDPGRLPADFASDEPMVTLTNFDFTFEASGTVAIGKDLHRKRLLAVAAGGLGDAVLFSQVCRTLRERFACVIDVAWNDKVADRDTFVKLFPASQIVPMQMPYRAFQKYHALLPLGMYHVFNGETVPEYIERAYGVPYEARGFAEDEDTEWNILTRLKHRHEVDPRTSPVIFLQAACRPLKHYTHTEALAQKLVERGHKVVLIGASHESAMRDKIGKLANLCGAPVWDTILAMKHAALVITPDSSFMHVAGALDKPALALYGPTSAFWSTAYPNVTAISHPSTCRFHPCWMPAERAPPCGFQREPPCLNQIPVDYIVRLAEQKLRGEKLPTLVDVPAIPKHQVVVDRLSLFRGTESRLA